MCLRQNKISEEGENTRHPPLFGAEDFYIRDLVSLLFEYLYLAEVHSLTRQATCVSYPDILCRYGKSHSSHLFLLKVVIFTRISSGSLSRKREVAPQFTPLSLKFSIFPKFPPLPWFFLRSHQNSHQFHRVPPTAWSQAVSLFLSLPSRRRC